MRRDQNRPKTSTTRRGVAVSAATLAVLVGVVGLETGASAFSSSHIQGQGHSGQEARRYVPGQTAGRRAPLTPMPTVSIPSTVLPAPTVTAPASGARTTPTGPSAPTTPTTVATPPVTTTTTTPPATTTNGAEPNAPASLNAPTTMVLDDEFNAGSLNTTLWSPNWFGNGSVSNGTTMLNSNVSVGSSGLALQLTPSITGGLVSTNPDDSQPGHAGFQIAPTATKPVFVEFKATLPATTNGQVANWPALWLDGQTWPEDGEIDVMEGGYGSTAFHIHYGAGSGSAQGATVNDLSGTHTYAVLWTTTGFTFLYDGVVVGTANEALTSPMYLLMENSYSSADPTVLPATMDVRYVRVWN